MKITHEYRPDIQALRVTASEGNSYAQQDIPLLELRGLSFEVQRELIARVEEDLKSIFPQTYPEFRMVDMRIAGQPVYQVSGRVQYAPEVASGSGWATVSGYTIRNSWGDCYGTMDSVTASPGPSVPPISAEEMAEWDEIDQAEEA